MVMAAQRAALVLPKVTLALLLINSVWTQEVRLRSDSELSALFDLRSSLGIRARYWPRKVDPCLNWTGVECQNGLVIGIKLSGLRRTRVGCLNPQFAVDSLANFTRLSSFNSSGFLLPGSIPAWFGQSLNALQVLDLRSCSIIGSIPPSLGSLSRLNILSLSNNSLNGIIPPSLGQLFSLSALNLSKNSLTGPIPSSFSALGNLTNLDMSSNILSGPIPSGFGLLYNLQFMNLSDNSLTASVPAQLGDLSRLVELDFGFNSLSGSLPEDLRGLRSLQKMVIGHNDLDGRLSGSLFLNLTQLQYVDLSWNHFDGDLPHNLWSMHRLRFLDVSNNNLTGVFPNLTGASSVAGTVLNISNNRFYGRVGSMVRKFHSDDLSGNYFEGLTPKDTVASIAITGNCFQSVPYQRSLEDCRMFYAERGLTFDNDSVPDSVQPPMAEPMKEKKRLTYVMAGVFGGLGFIVILVLVLVVVLKACGKKKVNRIGTSNTVPVPGGAIEPPPKVSINLSGLRESFTYEQMLEATSYFSDTNLIKHGHSGDLYHGTLEVGFPVVIKRVNLHFFRRESYIFELDLFGKVWHTRLVPFLGHCLELEHEILLVYKYMPNGDLSNSLHRFTNLEDGSPLSLDWITRLKIAIGAAEGLFYLHHECNPPLVHRDIQASSILLDDKYEVRLGSLSEVRIQGRDKHQNVITRLLHLPQTSEHSLAGSSSATCAYDVYCFGKVLLELVTGKLGISKSDDPTTKEWLEHNLTFISIHDKEMVAKIVDQSLIVDDDLLEEVWAVAIVAKSCLHPRPSRRPLIRHVLRALENPFKVVRDENFGSAGLRTTSSRRAWSAAFFGSWHHSSSEGSNIPGQTNREGTSGLKQSGRTGSQSSGANEHSSSHKRLSSEIFPEPMEMQDAEKHDGNQRASVE